MGQNGVSKNLPHIQCVLKCGALDLYGWNSENEEKPINLGRYPSNEHWDFIQNRNAFFEIDEQWTHKPSHILCVEPLGH